MNALIVRTVLERAGLTVRLATDFGAVDQILSGAGDPAQAMPELVVTDLNMPGGDGFSMVKRLRENEAMGPGRRLPVVVLTSDVRLEVRDRLVAAGADVVMPKPADPQRLMAEISRLLVTVSAEVVTVSPSEQGLCAVFMSLCCCRNVV